MNISRGTVCTLIGTLHDVAMEITFQIQEVAGDEEPYPLRAETFTRLLADVHSSIQRLAVLIAEEEGWEITSDTLAKARLDA